MATERNTNFDDVICRYFLTSSCRDGDNCMFSHDASRSVPDTVCRYFLRGMCAFGQHCRYDHMFDQSLAQQPSPVLSSSTAPSANNQKPAKISLLHESKGDQVPTNPTIGGYRQSGHIGGRDPTVVKNWVDAPEFVPKSKLSYVDALRTNIPDPTVNKIPPGELCPLFTAHHCCPSGEWCPYVHGDVCELCNKPCLHPRDEAQRKAHLAQCEKELELDMELSFAVQRSQGKACGICMDVVLEKEPASERRFGILERCNHVFCLSCIRQWRQCKGRPDGRSGGGGGLDPGVTRACPECRTRSDFVTPSPYYVDEEEEKKRLIADYQEALSRKPCRYFKKGKGTCPFGGSCFYLHALPDGTKVELPAPVRRRRQNQEGEIVDVNHVLLSEFLEHRDDEIFFTFDLIEFHRVDSDSDEDSF